MATVSLLDHISRLGWIDRATPVTALPQLAAQLGLASLTIKRDDACVALAGGSKPRKLDYLLAAAPWRDAPGWHALGAIGSGHLVAMSGAAQRLARPLALHCFWEPLSQRVLDNLAHIASGPGVLRFYGSRAAVALRRPRLLLGERLGEWAVVPPGGTTVEGMVGLVRAGLELGEQVAAGELPAPDRVVVALGTGGTAVGLSVGLALAGLRPELCAVATVERLLIPAWQVRRMQRALCHYLVAAGVAQAAELAPLAVTIVRNQLGRGYGHESAASRAACALLGGHDIALEGIYTGKAMAALLAEAGAADRPLAGRHLLFWHTAHARPLEIVGEWRQRLPARLRRRVARAEGRGPSRRGALVGGAAAVGLLAVARVTGYPSMAAWRGQVLAAWQAHLLEAAAAAVLPWASAAALRAVPRGVDGFLATLPRGLRWEIHGLLGFIEHGTGLAGFLGRFSSLTVAERVQFLLVLRDHGGLLGQAYRGVRDLCLLGLYQQPDAWPALGYEGPRLPPESHPRGPGRMVWPSYEALRAPAGTLPRGVVR